MTTTDIAELSVAEKLKLMEKLWDSLRAQADSSVTPAWHKEILAERLRRLDSGAEPVTPWSQARTRIREQTGAV